MEKAKLSERENTLQIEIPAVTKKSLRLRSAESGDTMRLIVLRALDAAGIQVPREELKDRRKGQSGVGIGNKNK